MGEPEIECERWVVSEILDDGRVGIVSWSNWIVYGLGAKLSRDEANRIVEEHNRTL